MSYSTFKLNSNWDVTIDSIGYLDFAINEHATAQDVACACSVFKGEIYVDSGAGIDYQGKYLGRPYSSAKLAMDLEREAMTISTVESVVCSVIFNAEGQAASIKILTTDNYGRQQGIIL
ncbi:hypothetical protein AB7W40_09950 [Providencia rettgeri]